MNQEIEMSAQLKPNDTRVGLKGAIHAEPYCVLETINPDRAVEILTHSNVNFRKLSTKRATKLADDLSAGVWDVNGETVKFNSDGTLKDGQHRLQACVVAGVPLKTFVVYGITNDVNIDSGVPRKLSDILSNQGETDVFALVASLRLMYKHEKGAMRAAGGGVASNYELIDVLRRHPGIRDSVRSTYSARSLMPPSVAGFVHYVASLKNAGAAGQFFNAIATGENLVKDDPAFVLRARLLANRSAKAKLHQIEVLALTIKAWSLYAAGRSVKTLKWTANGPSAQEFPSFE